MALMQLVREKDFSNMKLMEFQEMLDEEHALRTISGSKNHREGTNIKSCVMYYGKENKRGYGPYTYQEKKTQRELINKIRQYVDKWKVNCIENICYRNSVKSRKTDYELGQNHTMG